MVTSFTITIENIRFFDRETEFERLREIEEFSHEAARFTIITGKRRIGKTEMVKKFYENKTILYFFVDRRGENKIDIVAEDELENKIEFIEVKRQEKNFDETVLRAKSELLLRVVGSLKDLFTEDYLLRTCSRLYTH